jgi:Xylose isomerase-like TIM barrel
LRRREFLIGSMAAASVAAYGRAEAQDIIVKAKLDRVGAMSACFSTLLRERGGPPPDVPKELDALDFPDLLAHRYSIHNVEMQTIHFPSLETSYYEKFLARLKKANSRMINMSVQLDPTGFSGTITPCSPDPQIRAHAIELAKQWMDRAAMLECHSIMLNQGRSLDGDLTPAIDALKTLRDYGAPKDVAIIIEPRGGIPFDTLMKLIKGAGINANPDIGNFGDEEETERGLRLMYPLAKTVSHVKSNPDKFSFATAIAISKEMGFQGVFSIESGGPEPFANVQAIVDKLMIYL